MLRTGGKALEQFLLLSTNVSVGKSLKLSKFKLLYNNIQVQECFYVFFCLFFGFVLLSVLVFWGLKTVFFPFSINQV